MKIAMWSGPRNLSTALMYAFAQRRDMHVVDEPFYGPYLRRTGLAHPMRAAILQSRPESAEAVSAALSGAVPQGRAHAYHKHMCQHMIDGIPRDFMADCVNVFLIRHPARVVASFAKGYADLTAQDVGFALQAELFAHVTALGQTAVVIDSFAIRQNPERALQTLCDQINLPWDSAMLHWPKGPKPYDGVWAPHWYHAVHASTGFAGPEGALPQLTGRLGEIVEEAMPHYKALQAAQSV